MLELLILSVVQFAFGLVFVCTLLLMYSILWEHVHRFFWRRRNRKLYPPPVVNEAYVVSKGSWQYHDKFFDKIEEFRSDFA